MFFLVWAGSKCDSSKWTQSLRLETTIWGKNWKNNCDWIGKYIEKTRIYTMKETINQIYWIGNNNWKTRKYTLKKLLGQSMLIEWYTVKFRGKIYWEILGEKPTRGPESLLSQKVINIYYLKTPPHPMTHLETNWEYEPFQSQFILLQKKTLLEQFW